MKKPCFKIRKVSQNDDLTGYLRIIGIVQTRFHHKEVKSTKRMEQQMILERTSTFPLDNRKEGTRLIQEKLLLTFIC